MIEWLARYARWDTIAWLVLIAIGGVLEGLGVADRHLATFTSFVRSTVPVWARAALWGWLGYHFLMQK